MKRVLLLLPLLLGTQAIAGDLGSADLSKEKNEVASATFDAWCKEVGNECKVSFDGEIMSVDGSSGINRSQITDISLDYNCSWPAWNPCGSVHTYDKEYILKYQDSSGDSRSAKIIFRNQKVANSFRKLLQEWTNITIKTGDIGEFRNSPI